MTVTELRFAAPVVGSRGAVTTTPRAPFGLLPARSSTRSPRTTSGGVRGSPSGPTWPRPVRSSRATGSRTLPADLGFYDLRRARDPRGPGRAGAGARRRGVRLLALLVRRRSTASSSARSARCWRRGEPDISFCLALGQPDLDRHLARRRRPGADAAALPRRRRTTRRHFEPICSPAFRDERYLRSTDGRCSTSSGPRSCPTPPAFVDRWQAHGASRPASPASTSSRSASDLLGRGPTYTGGVADGFDAVGLHPAPRPDRAARRGRDAGSRASCCAVPRSTRTPATRRRCPPASTPTDYTPCVYPNWDNTPRSGRRRPGARTARRPRSSGRTSRAAVDTLSTGPARSACSG